MNTIEKVQKFNDFLESTKKYLTKEPKFTEQAIRARQRRFGQDYATLAGLVFNEQAKVEQFVLNNIMSDRYYDDQFSKGYLRAMNDVMQLLAEYEDDEILARAQKEYA